MPRPSDADQTARTIAAQQHGLVTLSGLRLAGLGRSQIRALGNAPQRWSSVTDEVFRLVGSPESQAQTVLAAVLDAGPGAYLSHQPAGRWWGDMGCALRPLQVIRTSTSTRGTELARLHRARWLPERWTTTHRGVPIVRPEVVALHLFAVCPYEQAERRVERMWSRRLLSGRSLRRFQCEYCRRGRDGSAGLRAYLEPRGVDYEPPASGLESRFDQITRGAGLSFRRQVDSGGEEHWTGRVDFRHETLPLIIEIQSEMHHSALVDRSSDERRLTDLRHAGYVTLEITDTLVWTDPRAVLDRVRDGIADAARLGTPRPSET